MVSSSFIRLLIDEQLQLPCCLLVSYCLIKSSSFIILLLDEQLRIPCCPFVLHCSRFAVLDTAQLMSNYNFHDISFWGRSHSKKVFTRTVILLRQDHRLIVANCHSHTLLWDLTAWLTKQWETMIGLIYIAALSPTYWKVTAWSPSYCDSLPCCGFIANWLTYCGILSHPHSCGIFLLLPTKQLEIKISSMASLPSCGIIANLLQHSCQLVN
jgi:hypothetical protein